MPILGSDFLALTIKFRTLAVIKPGTSANTLKKDIHNTVCPRPPSGRDTPNPVYRPKRPVYETGILVFRIASRRCTGTDCICIYLEG